MTRAIETAAREVLTWHVAMSSYRSALANARRRYNVAIAVLLRLDAERAKREHYRAAKPRGGRTM
jgi:hypothetical protein